MLNVHQRKYTIKDVPKITREVSVNPKMNVKYFHTEANKAVRNVYALTSFTFNGF